MIRHASLIARMSLASALLAATASGQMTGKYTIDPTGSGTRNFRT